MTAWRDLTYWRNATVEAATPIRMSAADAARRRLAARRAEDIAVWLRPPDGREAPPAPALAPAVWALRRFADAPPATSTLRGAFARTLAPDVSAAALFLLCNAPGDGPADQTHRRARASLCLDQTAGRRALVWAVRYGERLLRDAGRVSPPPTGGA